jgi:amidophosphoribosyltransferase
MTQCSGAYACTTMIAGFGLIAFRDPNGIRPVGLSTRQSTAKDGTEGTDYLFASESVVADALGFSNWEDVAPGSSLSRSLAMHRLSPSVPSSPSSSFPP